MEGENDEVGGVIGPNDAGNATVPLTKEATLPLTNDAAVYGVEGDVVEESTLDKIGRASCRERVC